MIARNKNQLLKIIQNKGGIDSIDPDLKIIIPSDDSRVANEVLPILSRLIELREISSAIKLIQRGADIDAGGSQGKLPIDYAIDLQSSTVIVELIKKGANAFYIKGRENIEIDQYNDEIYDSKEFRISETIAEVISWDKVKFANKLIKLFGCYPDESEAKELLLDIWSKYDDTRNKKDIDALLQEARNRELDREYKEEQESWEKKELEAKPNDKIFNNIVIEEEINLLAGEVLKSNITDLNPHES